MTNELLLLLVGIFAAAAVNMVVGFLWYLPFIFGNTWMRLTGLTQQKLKKRGMWAPLIGSFLAALAVAFVLSQLTTPFLGQAMLLTGWLWIAFVAGMRLPHYLFEGRPFKLFLLSIAHDLVSLYAMLITLYIVLYGL